MNNRNNEIQAGGTLAAHYKYYVKREADKSLYENLKEGELCYVLTSRQMGKSSLRVQVMHQLEQEGFLCHHLDLSGILSDDTEAESWYFMFVKSINDRLELIPELHKWWKQQEPLKPLAKMNLFIKEHLVPGLDSNFIIFIDEVDKLLSVNRERLRIDDFFAAIRAFYNARVDDPAMKQLNFAFFGVAAPGDLIDDPKSTPFNVGTEIVLHNFTRADLSVFKSALSNLKVDLDALLDEIYKWTNGQPILTTTLIKQIGEQEFYFHDISEKVRRYVSKGENLARDHFQYIEKRIYGQPRLGAHMVTLYQQLYYNIPVKYNAADPAIVYLKLSGLVLVKNMHLVINNAIYKEVFNKEWITSMLLYFNRPYAKELDQWLKHNKNPRYCLKGKELRKAAWKFRERTDLTEIEHQFLHISQEEARKRSRRRNYFVSIVGGVFFILVLVLVLENLQKNRNIDKLEFFTNKLENKQDALKAERDSVEMLNKQLEQTSESLSATVDSLDKTNKQLDERNAVVRKQKDQLSRLNSELTTQKRAIGYGYQARMQMNKPRKAMNLALKAYKLNDNELIRATLREAYKNFVPYDSIYVRADRIASLYYRKGFLYLVGTAKGVSTLYKYAPDGTMMNLAALRSPPRDVYVTSSDSVYVFYGKGMDVLNENLVLERKKSFKRHIWTAGYNRSNNEFVGLNMEGEICRELGTKMRTCNQLVKLDFNLASFIDQGRKIVTAKDNNLQVVNLNGELLHEFTLNANAEDWSYSIPLDRLAISTSANQIVFKSLNSGETHVTNLQSKANIVQVSEDGKMLLTCQADENVGLWDMTGQHLYGSFRISDKYGEFAMDAGNKHLFTEAKSGMVRWQNPVPAITYLSGNPRHVIYNHSDSSFYTFAPGRFEQLHRKRGLLDSKKLNSGQIISATVNKAGSFVAWADDAYKVHIYAREADTLIHPKLSDVSASSLEFVDDVLYLSNKEGYLLKADTFGRVSDTLTRKNGTALLDISVSPDTRWIATASRSRLYLVDRNTGEFKQLTRFFETGSSFSFTDDGKLLFSESGGKVVLYDVKKHKRLYAWDVNNNAIFCGWHSGQEALLTAPLYGKAVVRNRKGAAYQETAEFKHAFVTVQFIEEENMILTVTDKGVAYFHRLKPKLHWDDLLNNKPF